MRFAIISDFHLGFGNNTERFNDSFLALRQAFELAVKEKVDLILVPGDLFDEKVPNQETLHDSLELFAIPKKAEKSGITLTKLDKGNKREVNFRGIPVIAIHGTHEFRSKDYKNALQILEKANALHYMHANTFLIEKEGERIVALQGIGGVPEKHALGVFQTVNPKPVENAFNVFVFHQSLKEFLPTDDEMSVTLSLENLPKGFDIYIDGHLHWNNETRLDDGSLFLLPGSLIFTQMKRLEGEKPKGFFIFDSESRENRFVELSLQRKLFYHKLKFEESSPEEIKIKVKEVLEKDLANDFRLKPLVRLKLTGTLRKGYNPADLILENILQRFRDKAIFSVSKEFSAFSFKKKLKELRELHEKNSSVSEIGFELLEKNLKNTDFGNAFDIKRIFELLEEGEQDKALQVLKESKIKNENKCSEDCVKKDSVESKEKSESSQQKLFT